MKTKKEKKSAHAIYIYLLYIYSKRLRKGERVEQRPYIITHAIYSKYVYIACALFFSLLVFVRLYYMFYSVIYNIIYGINSCLSIYKKEQFLHRFNVKEKIYRPLKNI